MALQLLYVGQVSLLAYSDLKLPLILWTPDMVQRVIHVHMSNPALVFMLTYSQIILAAYTCYGFSLIFSKISLGIFFLRIFVVNTQAKMRRSIHVAVYLNVLLGMTAIVYYLAQPCKLTAFIFPRTDGCGANASISIILGGIVSLTSGLTDLLFASFAISVIWGTNMARSERAIAMLLLLLGTIACVFTFIRFSVIVARGVHVEDGAKLGFQISLWSLIELGLSIISTSLATLRPLLRLVHTKVWPTSVEETSVETMFRKPYDGSGHVVRLAMVT